MNTTMRYTAHKKKLIHFHTTAILHTPYLRFKNIYRGKTFYKRIVFCVVVVVFFNLFPFVIGEAYRI